MSLSINILKFFFKFDKMMTIYYPINIIKNISYLTRIVYAIEYIFLFRNMFEKSKV